MRSGSGNRPERRVSLWDLPAIQMRLKEDKGQQREEQLGLHVMWLSLLVHTTCVHVRALPRSPQASIDTHDYVLFASKRAEWRAESFLWLLFSPLHHHDNLLTPAQLHTANISLPSPVTCSSRAPHPPHPLSSHVCTLYSLPSSAVFSVSSSIFSFLHFPYSLHPTFT